MVVAVGILAILSVVGIIAYSKITENAHVAAVEAAAADVYTGAVAYDNNGDDYTQAATDWMESSDGSIAVGFDEDSSDGKICVVAEMPEYGIIAKKGAGCDEEGVVNPGNGGSAGGDSDSEAPNVDHVKIDAILTSPEFAGIDLEISLYGDGTKLDTINT